MKNVEERMAERDRTPLATRLRAEAFADGPTFSALLHERVMARLRASGLEALPAEAARRSGRLMARVVAGSAAAAMVVLGTWLVLRPGPSPTQLVANDPVPVLGIDPSCLIQPVRDTLTAPTAEAYESIKYGYLDKDVQRLAVFVANQIPSLPEPMPQ